MKIVLYIFLGLCAFFIGLPIALTILRSILQALLNYCERKEFEAQYRDRSNTSNSAGTANTTDGFTIKTARPETTRDTTTENHTEFVAITEQDSRLIPHSKQTPARNANTTKEGNRKNERQNRRNLGRHSTHSRRNILHAPLFHARFLLLPFRDFLRNRKTQGGEANRRTRRSSD